MATPSKANGADSADKLLIVNGLEQLITGGQFGNGFRALLIAELGRDSRVLALACRNFQTRLFEWVQFVKEHPECLTTSLTGPTPSATESEIDTARDKRHNLGPGNWQARFNGLLGRNKATQLTTPSITRLQSHVKTSFAETAFSPADLDLFERQSAHGQPFARMPPVPLSVPDPAATRRTQTPLQVMDLLTDDVSCQKLQIPLLNPTAITAPRKRSKRLSTSIWASEKEHPLNGTETCQMENILTSLTMLQPILVNGHPPGLDTTAKPKIEETQKILPSQMSVQVFSLLDDSLIDPGPMMEASGTHLTLTDSSDEDLIEFEPKVAKAFKPKGRGKFTMEMESWFMSDGRAEDERPEPEQRAKHENGKVDWETNEAVMLSLQDVAHFHVHPAFLRRLRHLKLEKAEKMEKRKQPEKKKRPVGELSYRKTNGLTADRW